MNLEVAFNYARDQRQSGDPEEGYSYLLKVLRFRSFTLIFVKLLMRAGAS